MRKSMWAVVVAVMALSVGCGGGDGGPGGEAVPWSLDPGVVDLGDGIPFCEAAMARVAQYMGQFEGQVPPDERYGGTVVVAAIGELGGGMNAHVSAAQESIEHQMFVNHMTLIQYDAELNPVPYLAESWEVSSDGTEITFHLRDDVYWHDGELTDAHDVAYTYRRAVDPDTGYPNAGYFTYFDQGSGGVEVVDSFTVRIRMRPHADFIDPWSQVAIMPQHLLEDVPSAELTQHPYGTVCPVGNGPFIFTQHRQGASWTFQANPAFPEELGGRPFLDRYIYRKIDNQTTILTDLLTENVDVHVAPDPDQMQAILDSDAVDLKVYPHRMVTFVAWNARRPQLADKRVRRAITKGTNRREMVDALWMGRARVLNGTLPTIHWAYDESIGTEAMAYEPDAARALLDEAGWIDRDGDGVRENAQDVRLSIELKYNQGSNLRQGVAEIMQAQLAEIGIEARPVEMDFNTLISQITNPALRDFDGWVIGFTMGFKADDADLFHSERIDGPFAFSGTQRADIDSYLDRLPLTLDRDEARPLWKEYLELIVDEQPWTFIYVSDRMHGVNKRLQNMNVDTRGDWVGIKDWWIPADQRRGGR